MLYRDVRSAKLVTTSFTLARNDAGSPEPLLRPLPTPGDEAGILDVYDPYLSYDAGTIPSSEMMALRGTALARA
jgi:hypothetical protein